MEVAGDVAACAATARALLRAARQTGEGFGGLLSTRAALPGWTGTAAGSWAGLAGRQAEAGYELADSLSAASHAVARHAEALTALQDRARQLTREAADAGLHLDDEGRIPPVHVPYGPLMHPEQRAAQQQALALADIRRDVMARARLLLDDVCRAHEDLARAITAATAPVVVTSVPTPSVAPTWTDAPPVLAQAVDTSTTVHGPAVGLPPGVVRGVGAGMAVGGFVYGTYVDLTQSDDMGPVEAVVKNLVAGGAAAGAGAGAVALGTASAFPPTAVVIGGVAAASGVGLVVNKTWSALTADGPRGTAAGPAGVRPTPSTTASAAGASRSRARPRPAAGPSPRAAAAPSGS